MLRSEGKEDAIVDSASRFVEIYREGSIGAPAAAEMKMKEGMDWAEDSRARVMAICNLFSISRAPVSVVGAGDSG